ncbi:hypothetical protein, partial [Trebonia sp.]|uniref:hypothetical protein n=1 Tax=Trebonia sp. TaxID=2767075 RepID=UPI003BB1F4E7
EYFAGSAFLSVDSFGDGWVHAGEAGVFAPDGLVQGHWLAAGVGGRSGCGIRSGPVAPPGGCLRSGDRHD